MHTYRLVFLLFLFPSVFGSHLLGQAPTSSLLGSIEKARIQPVFALQFWTYHSHNQHLYQADQNGYVPVSPRLISSIRRSRIGLKAKPHDQLSLTLVGAMDLVGRDVLDGTVGGSNNGASPKFRLWNALFQWQVLKNSSALYLSGGYFVPQLGRESLTSAFGVSSMEKAFTQNYIRRHLVGTGPGRASGLNLGGLWLSESAPIGMNYNLGLFSPVYPAFQGNSQGIEASPLLTGRVVVYLGDPEMKTYKMGGVANAFGKRNGISLGIGGAYQGATDLFQKNMALGGDFVANWQQLNLDGEWMWLQRDGNRQKDNNELRSFSYYSQAGHVRIGYNLPWKQGWFLEPAFLLSRFQGGLDTTSQQDALSVGSSSGVDQTYDLGLNWYLNQHKLKIGLHYTWRDGKAGELPPGSNINLYYFQSGAGAIQRGNWLGVSLVARV